MGLDSICRPSYSAHGGVVWREIGERVRTRQGVQIGLLLGVLVAALLVATGSSGAGAGTSTMQWPPVGQLKQHSSLFGLDPQLVGVTRSDITSGSDAALATARAQGLDVKGDDVRVIVDPAAGIDAAKAAIDSAGGEVEASVGGQGPGPGPTRLAPALRPGAPRSPP